MAEAGRAMTLYLRNRWLWGALGAAMAAAGAWLIWINEPAHSLVVGGLLTLADALATRIAITPDGIAYRRPWRRVAARWGELSHVEPVRAGGRAVPYLVLNSPAAPGVDLVVPAHLRGRAIPLRGPWTREGELDLELAIRRYAPLVFQSTPPPRPAPAGAGLYVPAAPPIQQLRTLAAAFLLLGAAIIALIVATEFVK
ncbi:MAG TPA: hypothetical protein VGE07_02735 [Herpetosiphonaceae bacterium]